MNNSLKYIIPIAIAIIGLIFWFFKCPLCILLPLLSMLGAGYIGWRLGLSELNERLFGMETKVNNYKNQLLVANANTSTSAEQSSKFEKNNAEIAQWNKRYNDLTDQKNRLNQEWEARYKTLESSQQATADTSNWREKYNALLLERDRLNQEWDVRYKTLERTKQSVTDNTNWSEKYNRLLHDKDKLNQEWEARYQALENTKQTVTESSNWSEKYNALLLEKDRLSQEWEARYKSLETTNQAATDNSNWREKYNGLLLEKGRLRQEWEAKYRLLENSKKSTVDTTELRSRYDALLLEKEQLNEEWELRYASLQSKADNHSKSSSSQKNWKSKYKALKDSFDSELTNWKSEKEDLLIRLSQSPSEVVRTVEVVKEVPVIREIEVVREVPVEIIKEVEVVKSIDMNSLEDMMSSLSQVEVSRTEKNGIAKSSAKSVSDDLTKIDGIGSAVSKLLTSNGINTFKKLGKMKKSALLGILDVGGKRFRMINPKSWPSQAQLASKGEWKALRKLQEKL